MHPCHPQSSPFAKPVTQDTVLAGGRQEEGEAGSFDPEPVRTEDIQNMLLVGHLKGVSRGVEAGASDPEPVRIEFDAAGRVLRRGWLQGISCGIETCIGTNSAGGG